MPLNVIRLSLLQNAMHTLYHAVEHLYWSEREDVKEGRAFNHEEHLVEWKNERGHLCFPLSDFTRLPAVYSLKFAMLHLIQAAELLLKAYVERQEPAAVFVKPGSRKTIDLRTALEFAIKRNPLLLSPSEYALLLEAKEFRNRIEHYQFNWEEAKFRVVCADFLTICLLLSQTLFSINMVEAFAWDHLKDEPDPIADYLSSVLDRASDLGRDIARRTGDLWAKANSAESVFRCLNCGALAVSRERGVCMGCGFEGDEEVVSMMADLEAAARKIAELRKLLGAAGRVQ